MPAPIARIQVFVAVNERGGWPGTSPAMTKSWV